ncbi:glycosyltransferase family 2 protein [Candidatus Roizmanbacteria bacterium]|nr:glycosyltransferase family 2 protein [Candidatus Roizmanbacteria bacterium]
MHNAKISNNAKVVIILPTYNEVDSIEPLITALQTIFEQEKRYVFSILVVDDNSPDGTAKKVHSLKRKFHNITLLAGEKKGLGAAYVRGMHYAIDHMQAAILFEMDADLSHPPKLIPQFLRKIEEGADLVIGSRYIQGGSIPADWAWNRKLYSIVGNLIIRFGLMIPRIHEWSSGFRAIRSSVFISVSAGLEQYAGYTFQAAFLHRVMQHGFTVAEVPLNFIDRKYGTSKFIAYEYIPGVLRYVLYNSSFIRFCIVGFTGFLINTIGLEAFYRMGLSPGIAASIGAEFAITSNFFFNNFWTFSYKRIRQKKSLMKKFFHFNTVAIGAVVIQGLVVGIGTSFFGDETRLIFLVLAVIVFIVPYSYFMYNRFIWKQSEG